MSLRAAYNLYTERITPRLHLHNICCEFDVGLQQAV